MTPPGVSGAGGNCWPASVTPRRCIPGSRRLSVRARLVAAAASRLSPDAGLPLIERAERADAGVYDDDPDAAPGMAADEHGHARTIAKLIDGGRPDPRQRIARRERWHRTDRSGALRAGVFGVSDGLVSNTALVMGVAGSGVSHTVILLAGTAGLLSGSFSMAAGEYVSMASQREMYEREISLEAQELQENPQEERDELVLLYRAKGLPRGDAERLADQIMSDRQVALDTLTREELGLDPDELGSPLAAAVSSLLTFAIGARIGVLNGRSPIRSGLRQLLLGGAAALITFGIGHLIGASVS